MSKSYHLCISVTGALRNWKDSLYVGCCTENGRVLEPWEVKAQFVQAAAEGKAVIPMDPSCDNFDFQKGCQGHEEPETCQHNLETHCDTDINGAGVHREYWQQCTKCREIFEVGEPT